MDSGDGTAFEVKSADVGASSPPVATAIPLVGPPASCAPPLVLAYCKELENKIVCPPSQMEEMRSLVTSLGYENATLRPLCDAHRVEFYGAGASPGSAELMASPLEDLEELKLNIRLLGVQVETIDNKIPLFAQVEIINNKIPLFAKTADMLAVAESIPNLIGEAVEGVVPAFSLSISAKMLTSFPRLARTPCENALLPDYVDVVAGRSHPRRFVRPWRVPRWCARFGDGVCRKCAPILLRTCTLYEQVDYVHAMAPALVLPVADKKKAATAADIATAA